MDLAEKSASPSQLETLKPATSAGFSFLRNYGDKMGTNIKYVNYKPAKLYCGGKKWFIYYSYLSAEGNKMVRFKVYEGINQIKDLKEKKEYASLLVQAVNYALSTGFNPFENPKDKLSVAVKNWTLIQGLNYFKQNLHTRGLRLRTIQSYESVLRMLYEYCKPILLQDIKAVTKVQLQACFQQAYQDKHWSNTTYNNNLTFIRSIFNWLIEAEVLEVNPTAKVKPLPENITRNKYFDNETFARIKKAAEPDLLEFILFLYDTGLRPNEARQVRYEHINRDSRLLFVPASISKNKKDDYVPLTDYILTKYVNKEGLIFGTSINHYTQKFAKLKAKLKLPDGYNLYGIKHTRAVHLAQDGASPYAIMELFRHSSLDITMKYLRGLGLTVNREAADKARKHET